MASATWSPAVQGNSATWDKNKTRADLQRNAVIYDDTATAYDDLLVFYNGYDPTTTTPEGEAGALWIEAAE